MAGRPKKDDADRRLHQINVAMNTTELTMLDKRRQAAGLSRAEFLRTAALNNAVVVVPAINEDQWDDLGRVTANLNQIAHHLNAGGGINFVEIKSLVEDLRKRLVGISL